MGISLNENVRNLNAYNVICLNKYIYFTVTQRGGGGVRAVVSMLHLNSSDLSGLQQTVMEGRFSDRQSWRLGSVVDITLLKFSSADDTQTVYLRSPLTDPALLIYQDWLPTLIAIIHSPVRRKAHRAAGLPACHKEPGRRGRRNESSYEMRGMFDLKTKAGDTFPQISLSINLFLSASAKY